DRRRAWPQMGVAGQADGGTRPGRGRLRGLAALDLPPLKALRTTGRSSLPLTRNNNAGTGPASQSRMGPATASVLEVLAQALERGELGHHLGQLLLRLGH